MPHWFFGTTVEEMNEMLHWAREFYSNVGLCFDMGHAHATGQLEGFLGSDVIKYTNHIHIHDNFGKEDEHLPLDRGNLPWRDVLDRLKDMEIEVERIIIESRNLEEGVESLQKLKEYLS